MKVYGPYTRKDGRQHIILYENGNRTTVSYPRYLLERKLGRKLKKWEEADHINEDFTDNRLSNLQVLTKRKNILKSIKPAELITFKCPTCKRKATKSASQVRHNNKRNKKGPYCSRRCAGIASHF